MVIFVGDSVLGKVAGGSGVGLLSVDEEVTFSSVYNKCKRFYLIKGNLNRVIAIVIIIL